MSVVNPLVSIIIPTYNRAHLIGETLDSIIAQTYSNWECLVVDDGSTDHSQTVFEQYRNKDARFKFFSRPATRPKGANACRNMGLENAQGDYIVFFDSDDLMTPDHLEVKINPLVSGTYDYSITKTKYFNAEDDSLERYYKFDEYELTAHNYIVQNLNWLTYDACIKASLAKSIRYNEALQSGQEYNYFSKLVLKSTHAVFIEKYVTLRRKHENSTQGKLRNTTLKGERSFKSMWETYQEIKDAMDMPTRKGLLYKCIRTIYRQNRFLAANKLEFLKEVYACYGMSGVVDFMMMLIGNRLFNKGFRYRNRLKLKTVQQ